MKRRFRSLGCEPGQLARAACFYCIPQAGKWLVPPNSSADLTYRPTLLRQRKSFLSRTSSSSSSALPVPLCDGGKFSNSGIAVSRPVSPLPRHPPGRFLEFLRWSGVAGQDRDQCPSFQEVESQHPAKRELAIGPNLIRGRSAQRLRYLSKTSVANSGK